MSLMKWGAGLILLNVIFAILIYNAGVSGLVIGETSLSDDTGEDNSYSFLRTISAGFSDMPFFMRMFLGTYQLLVIGLLIMLILRGVS